MLYIDCILHFEIEMHQNLKERHLAFLEKEKDLKKIRSTAGPSAVVDAATQLPTLGRVCPLNQCKADFS